MDPQQDSTTQQAMEEDAINLTSAKNESEQVDTSHCTLVEPMDIDTVNETVTNTNDNSVASSPLVMTPHPTITTGENNTSATNTATVVTVLEPTEQEQQQLQDLEAISQLQQMTAAQAQALASAAAALSNSSNFHFLANFSQDALAASVIAAAAANANNHNNSATNTNTTNTSNNDLLVQNNNNNTQQQNVSQLPTEVLKRELMNQKVRADNRERKKRWRQQNEERNKDNDLRCRVNKRAHKLFGKEDSEHKKKWIDDEFLKRQQKRKDKERRKGLVDDSLGGHHIHNTNTANGTIGNTSTNTNNSLDLLAAGSSTQTLQGLTDANYLTLLCNNLGIPAAARSLIGSAHGLTTNTTNNEDNTSQQETIAETTVEGGGETGDVKDKISFPFQLLEILQQLQQYQPQQQSTSDNTGEGSEFHLSSADQQFGNNLLNDESRPEEKLAALLTSTLHAANAAAVASSSSGSTNTVTTTKEEGMDVDSKNNNTNEGGEQQTNAEFPMDAVLTLMQLNAGWRQ